MSTRPGPKQIAVLLLLTAAAILIHGYHPYIEDGEIYVPGIKQALNPALYPYNRGFFASHAHLTWFPSLIAGFVHITHMPVDWALLLWQFLCVFLLLLACWQMGRLCFRDSRACWGGVALVASLLTIPVAGTALYIMDQYLNPRSLSTPALLFIAINSIERRFWSAALWTVFTAAIHPLMVVFGLSYAILLLGMEWSQARPRTRIVSAFLLLPFGLFPPVTGAYREVLQSRAYFFLLRWEWYEWLGIFAPLVLLWWFHRIARQQKLPMLDLLCRALIGFGLFFFVVALVITIPPRFANFAELQPMRNLQLVYILLFVFAGGLLAQFVLKDRAWRWLLLFAPLCASMWFAQRELFPATPHLEWPGREAKNDWVSAFLWVRGNTPVDAYFALDPDYMELPGEDQHGFRAIAERSRLADRIKDSGAVTMFPALAGTWHEQVGAQSGWKTFQVQDFHHLKETFGVNWVVLQRPGVAGLSCPYQNNTLLVCQVQ
ncbi:MAG: hypothetical protein AUH86_14560 [Acidobacteria bacterium 13_1_40CM_4_58_4]|nr:MAG: hypothetical protein AUH86_14560 [Acidobacteria bacterium 13_1_40CM_4_58_4]